MQDNIFNTPYPSIEEIKKKYGNTIYELAIQHIDLRQKEVEAKGGKHQINNYFIEYVCKELKTGLKNIKSF